MDTLSNLTFSTLADSVYTLHPYQEKAIESATNTLFENSGKAGILQMSTGTGKTVTVGMFLRKLVEEGKINRALFLVHRIELVKQAIGTFENCGLEVGHERGKERAFSLCDPHVVCTTVQTLSRRLEAFKPDDFEIIVTDEVHHAGKGVKIYENCFDRFPNAKLLGVTATVDRADKRSLERFGEVIYSYSLSDAIHDPQGPFLAPVKFVRCNLGADLRNCKTTGKKGDFDQADLARKIQPHVELFANAIEREIIGRNKIIVFMPDVGSSQAMSNALKQLGHAADWVSGDRKDRDQVVWRYKQGMLKILVNCQILTEGFDDKPTDCVVLKPTRSRIAYAQMVGRGTRLSPGKSDCLIVDFSHTTDLDLIGPASLADCDVRNHKSVEAIVDSGVDLWEAIERVKKDRAEKAAMYVPVGRLQLDYRRVEVNPFAIANRLGCGRQMVSSSNLYGEPPTEAQIRVLKNNGFEDLAGLTKKQATGLIGKIIERRIQGLCTVKQINYLVALGEKPEKVRRLTFEEATSLIDKRRSQMSDANW
jgi:superfamily II DNA or RNA helicase